MKIRKVSADVLDRPSRRARALSPREQRRIALERELETAIGRASANASAAFLIDLDADEKPATVRLAFNRVRDRTGSADVNLFSRGGTLLIAKRPQTRGRRPAG